MTILIYAEEASDKPKILSKVWIKENFFNLIKGNHEKHRATIMHNDKKTNFFFLLSSITRRIFALTIYILYGPSGLRKREIRFVHTREGEVKCLYHR